MSVPDDVVPPDAVDPRRRPGPGEHPFQSPHHGAAGQSAAQRAEQLEARARLRRSAEPWPTSVALTVQLLACALLFVAIAYGPSYYQCRRMKDGGMFFYGESVSACFRDKVAAQENSVDTAIRRWRSGL